MELWNILLLKPMLNFLMVLSSLLFHNFGLAIVVFTIIIRLITLPLTLKQLRVSRAMSSLQPKLQALQKQYVKDRQRLAQETAKLYREAGVSPLGCLMPMLIQLPIWIALYQSIIHAVRGTAEVSQYLYSWPIVQEAVQNLNPSFLWLNLGVPDRLYVLPLIVVATTWMQQKMITTPAADPKQQSLSSMMLWMMPLMLGFVSLAFPSGLALYWVISNLVGIVIQYFITGWGSLLPARVSVTEGKPGLKERMPAASGQGGGSSRQEKRQYYGKYRGKRKDSRRSHPARSGTVRSEPGESGDSDPQEG